MRRLLAGSTVLSLLLVPALVAWADPGDLDPTFGTGGVVLTEIPGGSGSVGAMAMDADGSAVLAGRVNSSGDLFVARYNTDGSLDATFAGDGMVVDDTNDFGLSPRGVAIDSNGSIVVAGVSGDSGLLLVRYLADGTRDNGFSGDGVVTGGLPPAVSVSSVAVDSQDRVVIGGAVIGGLSDWFVARYLPDGTLDTSFGGDGVVGHEGSHQYSAAVTVDGDDKVILAGAGGDPGQLRVLRWLEDGTLDTSFSGDGIASYAASVYVSATSIALDGAILVTGGTSNDGFVARVLADGTFDPDFSTDGFATVASLGLSAVVGDEAGGVIAVGEVGPDFFDFDLVVARFDVDGSLDTAFGDGGVYTYTPGVYDDRGMGVVIDAEGRLLVGGEATIGTDHVLLLRLEGVEPPATTTTTSSSSTSSSSSTTSTSSSTSTTVPSTTTTTTVPEEPEVPVFTDDEGSVFGADIAKLAQRGVTKGCNPPENTRFCPDEAVSRGQMAAFLIRILGEPEGMSDEDVFSDDNGSVFESDIEALAAWGVTRGCDSPANTRFCPEGQVTRGQMAAFLARAMDLPATDVDFFSDDEGSVFEADINRVAAAGVARGCNPPANDRFCPDQLVTRGQMAAFLVRGFFTD